MAGSDEIRDLGFLAWKDELAWTERMSGSRWTRLLSSENRRFTAALRGHEATAKRAASEARGIAQSRGSQEAWVWRGWDVGGESFSPTQVWRWVNGDGKFKVCAWDADVDDRTGLMAAAVPDPHGWERFEVAIYRTQGSKEPRKTAGPKGPAGPEVAWLGGTLLWLGSSADLRYDSIHAWDPIAEKDVELYRLDNPKENLELLRLEDGSVAVKVVDFRKERLGIILADGISWVAEGANVYPVDGGTWLIDGKPNRPINLPPLVPKGSEVLTDMSIKAGWAVTNNHGLKTLWDMGGTSQEPKAMVTVWGEVSADPRDPFRIDVNDMRYEAYTIRVPEWKMTSPEALPFPCTYHRYPSPMFVCHPRDRRQPKGLLINAYGAYGDPTRVGSLIPRWEYLLRHGWAVAAICVPGSGDHDLRWRRRGQREHRQVAIDSLKAAVADLQQELGVEPAKTVLYGRSAGGLLVISTAVQGPELIGGLYVESPYVDVLRTISNPELPLTTLETEEFGIGTSARNVLATGAWSPLEHIPADGLPGLFILARADTNDLEVYPYEVAKFILRARGAKDIGDKKLLRIHTGRGHFATTTETRAEDLVLLDAWVSRTKNRRTRYKQMANRKNVTRRNRKDRKDRKNRKNAVTRRNNATMAGGKRRKSGRKGTRRH